MRRYIFYLAVGIITFGVSLFAYISFALWKVNKLETNDVKRIETLQKTPEQFEFTEKPSKTDKDFKCENQYLLAVWNHLQKDNDYKEIFDNGIRQNDLKDCSEVIGIDELIDLNNDGNQEAIVTGRGWLNGISEISIWIVEKNKESYRVILDNGLGIYEIKNQKTEGFQDILISFKVSIQDSDKFLYQFSGKSYKPKKCWTETIAARDRQDRIYELKKPRIKNWNCWD